MKRMLALLLPLAALAGCQTTATVPAAPAAAQADGCRADETRLACDRRAILAMAGEYKVGFAFDEVTALRPGYQLKAPKRSGANEWVQVIEDTGTHIALQHTLVSDKGEVTKHWRQDWDYQATTTWAYIGNNTWQRRELKPEDAQGAWVQSVWQVDDSPRYAGVGRWNHDGNSAVWTSDTDWRPLPRREHTTRSDYDVLVAVNRHEIAADGAWVHLQDNLKLDSKAPAGSRYLAREFGANRYAKLSGFDFGPGKEYWTRTQGFWAQVRAGWAERFARAETITVKPKVDGLTLWLAMFEAAEEGPAEPAALKARAEAVLDQYLVVTPAQAVGAL